MKGTKLILIFVLAASLLLSACSGFGFTLAAPAAAPSAVEASAPLSQAAAQPATAVESSPALQPVANAPPAQVEVPAEFTTLQNAYTAVYQFVNPSVVSITVSSRVGANSGGNNSQDQIVPSGQGSGFIWDAAGHVVTNNHVIDGAEVISVTFSNGASYPAELTGADPNTDLAVIKVTGAPSDLIQPIRVGDSTKVQVGQLVVAIGNPFGLANTMTTGIVSAISRAIPAGASSNAPSFSIPDVIQTDAAINPGNSGGVLADMTGALIGVPSQIESTTGANTGIGFAIPSSIVSRVVPQLISTGKAANSYLGISGGTLTPEIVSEFKLETGQQGVLVATLAEGGPAETAGLKPTEVDASGNPTSAGDVITAIDGKPIIRFEDLVSYLSSSTSPGQVVTLTVIRGGEEIQVKVTLGTQPTN